MPTETSIRVTPGGLDLAGEPLPLLSGEVHYFRHDPSDWPRLLDAAAGLGLTIVSTYVPWGVHEVEAGRLDFGERGRARDLRRFLDLAAERSLRVCLRPGPHVNAELTWLGFPYRVLRDPRAMARTPRGNPVWLPLAPRALPIPSYASRYFLEEAGRWLAAFGEQIRDRQWPEGPVVMVQLDNEVPLLFRDGPFDQDYSDDALVAYRDFLEARGRPLRDPPTSFEAVTARDLLPYLEWVELKERIFSAALGRMRRALEGAGLRRVVFTHNVTQGGPVPPLAPGTLEAADLVGFDFYHQRRLLSAVRARCLYAAGTCELPWAAELGTGGPWNLPPLRGADTAALGLAAVAYGLRGCNLFMTAGRDRWYGAPVDEAGRPRGVAARRARSMLSAFREAAEGPLELRARTALVVPRAYVRLSIATWAAGPLVPPSIEAFGPGAALGCREDRFGLAGPIQVLWAEALERLTRALGRRGVGHLIVDGDAAEGRLRRHAVAVVPTFELFDRALWQRLLARAAEGLEVVVGPRMPEVGEDGEPLPIPAEVDPREGGEVGRGRLVVGDPSTEEGADAIARRLAARDELRSPARPLDDGIDVSLLEAAGRPAFVGVAELEGRRRSEARIEVGPWSATYVDVLSGARLEADGDVLELPGGLDAHGVRLFRLEAP